MANTPPTFEKAKLKWTAKIHVAPMVNIPINAGELECQFNPSSLKISKSNSWEYEKSPSYNAPSARFAGGDPATYSLSLFFDTYSQADPAKKDVRFFTNQLLQLTLRGGGRAMYLVPSDPPTVTFTWGKIALFSAVVENVEVTFTMFSSEGMPIRATADVTFRQKEKLGDDLIPAQNPTSRTDPRRTRIVHSSQRLDQIAYEEYEDPRQWRAIAEANNIDNPFQLFDGQILSIPQDQF